MASSRITVIPSALSELLPIFRMCGVFIDGTAESSNGTMELKISGVIVPDLPHVIGNIVHSQGADGSWQINCKFSEG